MIATSWFSTPVRSRIAAADSAATASGVVTVRSLAVESIRTGTVRYFEDAHRHRVDSRLRRRRAPTW
jgi:hypothetical protein